MRVLILASVLLLSGCLGAFSGATWVPRKIAQPVVAAVTPNKTPAPKPAKVPTLISITPAAGQVGENHQVTLKGTDFAAPLAINAGASIVPSNINVLNQKTAIATLAVAPFADKGPVPVTVTTSMGTSGAQPFTITWPEVRVLPNLFCVGPPVPGSPCEVFPR